MKAEFLGLLTLIDIKLNFYTVLEQQNDSRANCLWYAEMRVTNRILFWDWEVQDILHSKNDVSEDEWLRLKMFQL